MYYITNSVIFTNIHNPLFYRRIDLSKEKRFDIACRAMHAAWGDVTKIAKENNISRQSIYTFKSDLENGIEQIFGSKSSNSIEVNINNILTTILSLRLEGKCGIIPISQIMNRFKFPKYFSVGSISTILNYFGSYLPYTIECENAGIKYVIIASDEIFAHRIPILLTVDPISSCILRIELASSRDVMQWEKHWKCIQNNGYSAIYLVNDEGISMACAQKTVFPDIVRQTDTFHGVAHKLGLWVNRLEISAFKAIDYEYDRYIRLDSAKTDKTMDKIIDQHKKACLDSQEAIQLYDDFHYLYLELINTLQVFDKNGNLNSRIDAERNVETIIELLEGFGINSLNKELKSIINLLPQLFPFLDQAKDVYTELQKLPIQEDILKSFCIAWKYQKNWIKAKNNNRHDYYKKKEIFELELLQYILGDDFLVLKDIIYSKLDTIIQSSAIVENINSIIRIYLNTTKNHITQNFLNLIMFYLNHRRYYDGKRKNKTPMELFTGKKQDKDWLEFLLEKVPWQNYNFFQSN